MKHKQTQTKHKEKRTNSQKTHKKHKKHKDTNIKVHTQTYINIH